MAILLILAKPSLCVVGYFQMLEQNALQQNQHIKDGLSSTWHIPTSATNISSATTAVTVVQTSRVPGERISIWITTQTRNNHVVAMLKGAVRSNFDVETSDNIDHD